MNKSISLRCERLQADKPNLNRRVYSRSVLQSIVDKAQGKIANRTMFGGLGANKGPLRLYDASHLVTKLILSEDGFLVADIEVLSTEPGIKLQQMLHSLGQDNLEIVPSGIGSVTLRKDDYSYVGEDYSLRSIDVVTKLNLNVKKEIGNTTQISVPIVVDESGNCYSIAWKSCIGDMPSKSELLDQVFEAHKNAFPDSRSRVVRWANITVSVPESETEIQGSIVAE